MAREDRRKIEERGRRRCYLIPAEHSDLLSETAEGELFNEEPALFIAFLNRDEVLDLARRVHERTRVCGGFIEVETEWAEGKIIKNEVFSRWDRISEGAFLLPSGHRFKVESVTTFLSFLDTNFMMSCLEKLTSFKGRVWDDPQGIAASEWVEERMAAIAVGKPGITVSRHELVEPDKQFSVIARVQGAQPDLPGVVLGAHLDTIDTKYGADDDASGVAAVMTVYKALLDSGLVLDRDVYFMLYAAEEVGLRGSCGIAREFATKDKKLVGVMQLDMIGYDPDATSEKIFFVKDGTDVALTSFVKDIARQYLGVYVDDTPLSEYGSDHFAWHKAGYATVFPFEAHISMSNPNIHKNSDKLNLLSEKHMYLFLWLAGAFVVELASL